MPGFAIRAFTPDDAGTYFDEVNEYGIIQETPAPGVATVVVTNSGNVTSFSFSIQGSHDGVLFEDIEDFNAVNAAGAYQIGGPWPYVKMLLDAITIGPGNGLIVSLCWKYD